MFNVEADQPKQLLTISFAQRVLAEEASNCAEEVRRRLADLTPGFRLLTDLSGLDSMDPHCAPHIKRTMDLCNAHGVSKVVRVIPDPRKDIGLNIMSLFHYRRATRLVTCKTLEEAVAVLTD